MIVRVENKKQLKKFVSFGKELYKDEPNYVCPFISVQMRELAPLVIEDKTYFALYTEREGAIRARILYTFGTDRKTGKPACYFSFFDFYDDLDAARELTEAMSAHAREAGIDRLEGPYCPYDPDTRRGVLTNCYDKLPSVFLTYNYPYYVDIYESLGFTKLTDTLSMTVPTTEKVYKKAKRIAALYKGDKLEISTLNRKDIRRDIQAIADIMAVATTEINYESAPGYAMIEEIFNGMKLFIKDEYVLIARERDTGRAVGFVIFLPELNQIFRHLGGKLNIFKYFYYRKSVNKVRGWLQYIIPEYQGTLLLGLMFGKAAEVLEADGIVEFEGGTVVEENRKSYSVFENFGGYIDKIYRIYERSEM